MTDLSSITETFDSIEAIVAEQNGGDASRLHPPGQARTVFQDTLYQTILPRRVTVRGSGGARLSVIAKNRRIVKITEVHPTRLWEGVTAPQETDCVTEFEAFAKPLASSFIKITGSKGVEIDTAILRDPLGAVKPGYPAAMLATHIDKLLEIEDAIDPIATSVEAFPGLTRANFGNDTSLVIAEGSVVTEDWLETRVTEFQVSLSPAQQELRYFVLEGTPSRWVAMIWRGGKGCILVAETPVDADALEQHVNGLKGYF